MNDPLQTTLVDAVEFLERHGVRYALVGGLAASLRGQPRVTADVDMVIEVDIDGALALLADINVSKFAPLFADVTEVVKTAFILPARHRTTGVKLDLAIGLSGFERQTIQRAETLELGSCHVTVASAEDLLVMKILAGRPQDEQDIRGIIVAQADRIDWMYCFDLADQLGQAVGQDLVRRLIVLRGETTS